MRFAPALLSIALIAQPLFAEDGETPLWRDLLQGDDPGVVAGKLSAHPDIKSVKVKKGRISSLSISYRAGGISIFGQAFHLVTIFDDHGLQQVGMGTDKVCANDTAETFKDMLRALNEKYPESLGPVGMPSASELSRAFIKGTDESPVSVGRFVTDGKVVVGYQQMFTAEAPPPTGYTSNATMNALAQLLRNQYRARASECSDTGAHRVQHVVTYMTKDRFEAELRSMQDQSKEAIEAAKSNL